MTAEILDCGPNFIGVSADDGGHPGLGFSGGFCHGLATHRYQTNCGGRRNCASNCCGCEFSYRVSSHHVRKQLCGSGTELCGYRFPSQQ